MTSPATDIKTTLDAFLLATHRHAIEVQHAKAIPLVELAKKVEISEPLAEKVAEFLESEGLVDYDDQAVDITILGIVRAEKLLGRGTEGAEEELPRPEPRAPRAPRRR